MAFIPPVAVPPEAGGIILMSLTEKSDEVIMLVTVDQFPFLDVGQTGKIVQPLLHDHEHLFETGVGGQIQEYIVKRNIKLIILGIERAGKTLLNTDPHVPVKPLHPIQMAGRETI